MTVPTDPDPGVNARPLTGRLLRAAVAVLGAGTAGAIAGVIAAPIFVPATWALALGLLLAAAAGVLGASGGRVRGS